jgi:hypothetical protein
MAGKRLLPPPKGADAAAQAARDAVLGSRFQREDASTPAAPTPAVVEQAPAGRLRPTRSAKRRGEPDGMTRRTVYISTGTATALDSALERIQAATGGRVPKHEALAALIAAGVDQVDQVTEHLREQLLRSLNDG